MDHDTDWTANALFSPSKARIAQAQAKDWGFVDAWLARKYGSRGIPSLERNEETLQALLTLATLNEGADEQRAAVERVEKAALQASGKQSTDQTTEIYEEIMQHLDRDGYEFLNHISQLMVDYDVPLNQGTSGLASAIIAYQNERFDLAQQQERVQAQQEALKREQIRALAQLWELKQETFDTPAGLPAETVEWTKASKQLKAKLAEYDERLSALRMSAQPSVTVYDVQRQAEDVEAQRQRLSRLNAELKAYQCLPTNTREARSHLEKARNELRQLTHRRDQLFEDLVSAG